VPSTKGTFYWGGWAGTVFWVDPEEELIAVGMSQQNSSSFFFQTLVRTLVYQAVVE
jgi:CubicO group peptidase (beta-lactamase class C family)